MLRYSFCYNFNNQLAHYNETLTSYIPEKLEYKWIGLLNYNDAGSVFEWSSSEGGYLHIKSQGAGNSGDDDAWIDPDGEPSTDQTMASNTTPIVGGDMNKNPIISNDVIDPRGNKGGHGPVSIYPPGKRKRNIGKVKGPAGERFKREEGVFRGLGPKDDFWPIPPPSYNPWWW